MALSQLDIMIIRIRILIGDYNDDANENRYTDTQIKKMLRVAIEQDSGLNSVGLGGASNISSLEDDVYTEYTIGGMSQSAEALYCIAAQLLILESEYYKYIAEGGGIALSLGPQTIDEKSVIISMRDNLKTLRSTYTTYLREYTLGKKLLPIRIPLYDTDRVSD